MSLQENKNKNKIERLTTAVEKPEYLHAGFIRYAKIVSCSKHETVQMLRLKSKRMTVLAGR